MKHNIGIVLISGLIVISTALSDHFYAPMGIELTPLIIPVVTALVALVTKGIRLINRVIIIYILIAINDLGIKLYGGGFHDNEGIGFMNMFLLLGIIPCFAILIWAAIKSNLDSFIKNVLPLFLFVFLVAWHFYFLGNIGLGRYFKIYN